MTDQRAFISWTVNNHDTNTTRTQLVFVDCIVHIETTETTEHFGVTIALTNGKTLYYFDEEARVFLKGFEKATKDKAHQ